MRLHRSGLLSVIWSEPNAPLSTWKISSILSIKSEPLWMSKTPNRKTNTDWSRFKVGSIRRLLYPISHWKSSSMNKSYLSCNLHFRPTFLLITSLTRSMKSIDQNYYRPSKLLTITMKKTAKIFQELFKEGWTLLKMIKIMKNYKNYLKMRRNSLTLQVKRMT